LKTILHEISLDPQAAVLWRDKLAAKLQRSAPIENNPTDQVHDKLSEEAPEEERSPQTNEETVEMSWEEDAADYAGAQPLDEQWEDDEPKRKRICRAQVSLTADVQHLESLELSSKFPKTTGPWYLPSDFQANILRHMAWQRQVTKHRVGLVVMATAMGKTVLSILDIEAEIRDLNKRYPNYGVKRVVNSHWLAGNKVVRPIREPGWLSFSCMCSRHEEVRLATGGLVDPCGDDKVDRTQRIGRTIKLIPFRMLFIVHTKSIRDAAYTKFKRHFSATYNLAPSDFVRVERLTSNREIKAARFVFCLYQSFERLPDKEFTHVVIDEVHHLIAETWRRVYQEFENSQTCQYVLGMTATLRHRDDPKGERLKRMFKNQVYICFPWMVAKDLGYFPDVEYLEAIPTLENGKDIKTYAQLLQEYKDSKNLDRFLAQLDYSSRQAPKWRLIAEKVGRTLIKYQEMREMCNLSKRKRILVFASDTDEATSLGRYLNHKGVLSGVVHYKVKDAAQANIFTNFREGKINVLINVNVVSEGYDLPKLDMVVLARSTASEIVYVQQMGRALRKDPDDPNASVCVLDLAINLRRRWQLLRTNVPDSVLAEQILGFWEVSNFVGMSC